MVQDLNDHPRQSLHTAETGGGRNPQLWQYVFWCNPDLLEGYNSEHWKLQKAKADAATPKD